MQCAVRSAEAMVEMDHYNDLSAEYRMEGT